MVKTTSYHALKIYFGYSYTEKCSHAKRIGLLKILLVKGSSHKLFKITLASPKMLYLLFYINIMEIKENDQVVSWIGM